MNKLLKQTLALALTLGLCPALASGQMSATARQATDGARSHSTATRALVAPVGCPIGVNPQVDITSGASRTLPVCAPGQTSVSRSRFVEVDKIANVDDCVQNQAEAQQTLPVLRVASNSTTAPAPVSELTPDFPDGNLRGSVSFTMPTKNMRGEVLRSSGHYVYNLFVRRGTNTNEVITSKAGNASVGERVTLEIEVSRLGLYQFEVFVFDADWQLYSDTEICQYDVGERSPVLADKARLAKIPGSQSLLLTWGIEGYQSYNLLAKNRKNDCFFFCEDSVRYNIYRYPGKVLVAENLADTFFIDNSLNVNQLVGYHYCVDVLYKGQSNGEMYLDKTQSNRISIGPAMSIPFSQNDTDLSAWSTINETLEAYTWKCTIDNPAYFYITTGTNEDTWLVSPRLALDPGVYKLSFRHFNTYSQHVPVTWFGREPSIDALQTELRSYLHDTAKNDVYAQYIVVNESQDGYWAIETKFHSGYDHLRNLTIERYGALSVPDSVTSLTAIQTLPAASSATLRFCAPVNNAAGEPLAKPLTKIEIYRNDVLISAIDSPVAGEWYSYTDSPQDGFSIYRIVPCNADGAGLPSFATIYTGMDRPTDVESVKVRIDQSGSIRLTWDRVTTGVNGYPVGDVTYRVMMLNDRTNEQTILATRLQDNEYTTSDIDIFGDPRLLCLYVLAENEKYSSENWKGDIVVVGSSQAIPWYDSYIGGVAQKYLYATRRADSNGVLLAAWALVSDDGVRSQPGCIMAKSDVKDPIAMYTANLDLSKAEDPMLSFYVKFKQSIGRLSVQMITNYTDEPISCGDAMSFSDFGDKEWHYVGIFS